MKLISCQNGRLLTSLKSEADVTAHNDVIPTGFSALDSIAPDGGFARGAIHELLFEPAHGAPRLLSIMLARAIHRSIGQAIVWSDPQQDLYVPAIQASGIPLDRLYLLRPQKRDDLIWSITECLRCKGVAATIASIDALSRIEARRLQLAAERGGGMGLLMRSMIQTRDGVQAPPIYAAATRWLVTPTQGERTVQRWKVQLIHGHGGRVGETVILEHSRETNLVRATEKLADRPLEAQTRRIRA